MGTHEHPPAWPERSVDLIPVEQHQARCLDLVSVLAPQHRALADALGCVLAQDVSAEIAVPSFANSSMDGYVVLASDLADASAQAPRVLPVVGDIAAGADGIMALAQGTAMRIMTGAPVPAGADAVVPVEATDGGLVTVTFTAPVESGACIRGIGEDVEAGELLLKAGQRLGARHLGLLATVGIPQVLVHPKPRVVVISTGSELVDPGSPPAPGQIYDSNGIALTAAATQVGADASWVGRVADDEQRLMSALEGQLAFADAIITSGGVSAGAFDTVKQVLRNLGSVDFLKVAMQPGMPQGVGLLTAPDGRQVPIFTLPGNPVSAMVSFEVFVAPALRKMRAAQTWVPPMVSAMAVGEWKSPPAKQQYVRVRLAVDELSGGWLATPVGGPGSHLVHDLSQAQALAVVPVGVSAVHGGDMISCIRLEHPDV